MSLPCVLSLSLWKVCDQINAKGFYRVCVCVYVCVSAYAFVHAGGCVYLLLVWNFHLLSCQLQGLQVGTTVTTDLFCFVIVVAGDSTYASGQPD